MGNHKFNFITKCPTNNTTGAKETLRIPIITITLTMEVKTIIQITPSQVREDPRMIMLAEISSVSTAIRPISHIPRFIPT